MVVIKVSQGEAGVRLDRVLRKRLELMALSRIYGLVRTGNVRINGKKTKQDYRLQAGDEIAINVSEAELSMPNQRSAGTFERIAKTEFFKNNFTVLYEDADLLACNKPPGLVVHSGSGHTRQDTLMDLALAYLVTGKKIAPDDEPALVHRLDRDTSGVILLAKHKQALRRCHEAFRERDCTKVYSAICHNRPPKNEGIIECKLSRGRDDEGETTMQVSDNGVFSRSAYRLDAFHHDLSRVEVDLDTGKTHQIRVHLAHIGTPIVGDSRYGDSTLDRALFEGRSACRKRLYLHAQRMELEHPGNGRHLVIQAPLPADFATLMEV